MECIELLFYQFLKCCVEIFLELVVFIEFVDLVGFSGCVIVLCMIEKCFCQVEQFGSFFDLGQGMCFVGLQVVYLFDCMFVFLYGCSLRGFCYVFLLLVLLVV